MLMEKSLIVFNIQLGMGQMVKQLHKKIYLELIMNNCGTCQVLPHVNLDS